MRFRTDGIVNRKCMKSEDDKRWTELNEIQQRIDLLRQNFKDSRWNDI